jgi:UDP-2,3-diacylglucosamine pyrophosphatase LpxH
VRALFISDVHLGMPASQAKRLLRFLQCHRADTIYLVGDIVDGWRLLRKRSWPVSHAAVMADLVARAQAGVRVIYIPGNHDEYLRPFIGATIGGVEITDRAIHESQNGQRYLVLHGDQFDRMLRRMPWVALLGGAAYRASLAFHHTAAMEGRFWQYYRTVSARTKLTIRTAMNALNHADELLVTEARRLDVDGVICGHTHHPADRQLDGLRYLNTGDWVESCTCVVEQMDGQVVMVRWGDFGTVPHTAPQMTAAAADGIAA